MKGNLAVDHLDLVKQMMSDFFGVNPMPQNAPEKPKCSACPECGDHAIDPESEDVLDPGFRICAACGQEWWTDIDYTKSGL